jgi:hypothetical protein
MRSSHLLDMARRVADHVAAGYYPAEDGVSMIARQYGYDVPLIREIRTQLSEDPDTLPVCLSLLDRAAETPPPRTLHLDRPDAGRLYRGSLRTATTMAMTAPGGWRVVPIRLERGGRVLDLYRVTQHGVFVCECHTPAEVAAAGVPMDALREEEAPGTDA